MTDERIPGVTLICADRVFDGHRMTSTNTGVAIRGERILAVDRREQLLRTYGKDTPIHDFPGCTLLPGLIDTHTHLVMPGTGVDIMQWSQEADDVLLMVALKNAWRALQAGVTTVVDLGAKDSLSFRLRHLQQKGTVYGARLILCGRALTITGGHGWPWGGECDGVEEVRIAVRSLCKEGADLIKVMVTGGGTPGTDGRRPAYMLEELKSIVEEAHRHNRPVFAHCTAAKGIELGLDAGVDVIAHCQFLRPDGSNPYDPHLAQRILEQGTFVNPTLQINRILRSERVDRSRLSPAQAAKLDVWISRYPEFMDAFHRLYSLGIPMISGSDCGWGYSTFDEQYLELDAMIEAGMNNVDALLSATSQAALALRWEDRIGALQPNLFADLLVVEGDPLADITNLAQVRGVWLAGKRSDAQVPFLT